MSNKKTLPYNEWYDLNEIEILIDCVESGTIKDVNFDMEREMKKRYKEYTNKQK